MIKSDSLVKKYSKESRISGKEMNEIMAFKSSWKNVLLRDNKTKLGIFQDLANKTFQYDEIIPNLKWELENETKSILNYNCKKATTEYRGRKYTAWYTSEIPISYGPYIFEGLPGLILEVSDSKDNFLFTAIGIDSEPREIYLNTHKNILKVSRDQFRKAQKSYYNNPSFYLNGGAFNLDGTEMKLDPKFNIPYNPIELE